MLKLEKTATPELFINTEYRELLPKKTNFEYKAFEEDILHFGCQQPILITANNVILDGHYRYEICKNHDLPFRTEIIEGLFDPSEATFEAAWLDYENNIDDLMEEAWL